MFLTVYEQAELLLIRLVLPILQNAEKGYDLCLAHC